MSFQKTNLQGAYLVTVEPHEDERGFFSRNWCAEEFTNQGLIGTIAQTSISFNKKKNTLRGMHYSVPPANEVKIVRCTAGSVYDVIVDVRPNSPSYMMQQGFELTAKNHNALYIPPGIAHGFLTLEDNTELLYMMNDPYKPQCGRGFKWDDSMFNIHWPAGNYIVHERDRSYIDFNPSMLKELSDYS